MCSGPCVETSELETERVGRNKILTLVHKLDPGTTAGFSTLHLQSVCPNVAQGPVSTAQCIEKQVKEQFWRAGHDKHVSTSVLSTLLSAEKVINVET